MKETLKLIYNTLDQVEVKGHKNVTYLTGCLNELQKLLQEMESKESELELQA